MKNWKTTVTAIVGAIASLVGHFGFDINTEAQMAIVTVTMLIIGLLAKDSNVTGGTTAATPEAARRVNIQGVSK